MSKRHRVCQCAVCVDCHRRIHGREFFVWGVFFPNSTMPAAMTGPLHETHLVRYGWDKVWGWQ